MQSLMLFVEPPLFFLWAVGPRKTRWLFLVLMLVLVLIFSLVERAFTL